MEASRGQNGIQLLLAAEQEAQHIVNAAKNGMYAVHMYVQFLCVLYIWCLTITTNRSAEINLKNYRHNTFDL